MKTLNELTATQKAVIIGLIAVFILGIISIVFGIITELENDHLWYFAAPLMRFPRVRNMESNGGRYVPNQFRIESENQTVFQSYSSIIAVKDWATNTLYLDADKYDYSRTTSRYRNAFLNCDTRTLERWIKDGQTDTDFTSFGCFKVVLTELNK